jgi:hypothetical protein
MMTPCVCNPQRDGAIVLCCLWTARERRQESDYDGSRAD